MRSLTCAFTLVAIVMKPSELAPITVIDFAQLLVDAGLPPGVFNVVPGDGRETGSVRNCHAPSL